MAPKTMKHRSASPPIMPPIMGPRLLFEVEDEAGALAVVDVGILEVDVVEPESAVDPAETPGTVNDVLVVGTDD